MFTLQTTNVPAGTKYAYVLSGVSAADIDGGQLTGEVTIGADGKAYISTNLTADNLTEGAETLTLTTAGKTVSVTVNDTSTTPAPVVVVPTYALSSGAASVNEGGTAVFTLDTTNVASGSKLGYVLSGVSAADVVGGQLTGEATVGVDGKAYISVNLAADATTEGTETLTVTAAGKTASVAVADTSTTPVAVVPTYTLAANAASVAEGATMFFDLATTGVAAGTKISYKVTGTGSAAGLTASGVAEVDSTGAAIIAVTSSANAVIGDAGSVKVELLNGKAAAVTTALSDATATTYGADAISDANAANAPLTITVTGTAPQTITLGTDQITATSGFVINASSTAVTVNAGAGNDRITVNGNANNTISTGAGNDTVTVSGSGANTVDVGAGTDTVTGGSGNDTIVMGLGALDTNDRITGGDGVDTLVISGDGNVVNSTNVVGVESLVLNGTTVTIADLTSLAALKSISGHADTSAVTVTVATGDVVDLTGISLTTIKSITLNGAGTVTLKANGNDLNAVGAILKTGVTTVNLSTDVAGYKALSVADTGINGTKTVTASAADIIANKADLTGATLVVSGNISGADALALANAGITATRTVNMTVAEVIKTLQYPDQVAALAGSKLQITGNATYAQYSTIAANSTISAALLSAYDAATGGYKGVAIADTTSNLAANASTINTAITGHTVGSVAINGGAALTVANATALTGITGVTGSYSVADSASAINTAITSVSSLPAVLTGASSVALTTGNREVSTVSNALELKALGSKLAGGYDVAISTTDALTTDGLSAIAGATKTTLTGTVSVSQLNQILASNSAATVTVLQDNAQNLVAASSKLSSVTTDLIIEGTVTTAQAAVINPALTSILAKNGGAGHTSYGVSGSLYTNGYKISDVSSAVLDASNATAVKGAQAVEVTNAMTLADATALRALADASNTDNLANTALTYTVTDTAAALATALGATSNTTTVAVLAGAATSGVTATGKATVAQANILGAQYSSAVQVDSWAISDTVANLFSTGSTLVDLTAAKAKATALSVQGAVTNAQMVALRGVQNSASAYVFDNAYAIADSSSNIATAATSSPTNLVAATSITLTDAATVGSLAGLATLNTALTAAGKANVSYALTDSYSNVVGTSALGATAVSAGSASAAAAVIASAKAASLITVTGNFASSANTSTITAARLLDLSAAAGTATYTVNVTATEAEIAAQQAGVLNNSAISKITITSPIAIVGTNGAAVDGAAELLAAIGQSVMNKVSYSVSDTAAHLTDAQYRDLVLAADNITASDASVTVDVAQQLLALTGAKGTVTYTLGDTYAAVAANPTVADAAGTITVSDSALTAAQYDNLINLAKATSTVSTTVTQKAITDTAANISSATVQALAAASTITPTDVAKVTLSAAQARAVYDGTSATKLATSGLPGGAASVQVEVRDTTANLLAAAADGALAGGGSATTTSAANAFALNASNQYLVTATDVATLSATQMTSLRGISHISASYNLSDTADNLTTGGTTAVTGISAANNITVTSATGHETTAALAKVIFDANSKVSFAVITDTAAHVGASTGSGSSLVYTYAAAAAKAASVVISTAASVADMKAAKAAVGTTAVTYSLSDTAENLASTDGQALLAGATGLALSSGVATAAEAAILSGYIGKFSVSGFAVTDTAAALVANVAAAKAALGTVTVGSGTTSVDQYQTLKGALGTALASTTVTDTAAKLADFLIAGSTAGGYSISGSKAVTVAQANKILTTTGLTATTTLEVSGTSADLLAMSNNSQAKYTASDVLDLATAKQMVSTFTAAKSVFAVSTTGERFVSAYTYDTDSGTAGVQQDTTALSALQTATTLTVDGVAVTLGAKNASLTAASRTTYNGKIVGTVDQINALPANLKTAAGYVVVDSLANITAAANTAVIAAGSGYVVKDTAANITAAGSNVLQTASGALGIEVDGAISVATLNTILANTNTDNYVKYSLADSAANLVSGSSAVAGVSGATNVTVSGTATKAQADALFTANAATTVNVVDTGANIAASSNIGKFASIVADADLSTAGIQAISLSAADTIVRGKASTAALTFNVDATASALATAVGNTATTGANAATLAAAGTISVTSGVSGTAATADQAHALATLTVTGGYAVADTAAALTTTTTVTAAELAKATIVKVDNSGTDATYAQAVTLLALANIEKGTGANADKANIDIADSAKNLSAASAAVLDSVTSTNTISVSYTAALTAAEATSLAAVDAASTKLSTTAGSVKVSDTSANILNAANATAIAAVGTIDVTDVISVATLNQVKTAGGTANSEVYTYKLADTAAHLIVAGATTVNNATSVEVTGSVSVQDAALVYTQAATSQGIDPATANLKYDLITGTAADITGTNGLATGVTALSKATTVALTGAGSIANNKTILASGKLVGGYAVADTTAAILTAITNADKSVLDGATSVTLSSGQVANVSQAKVIASQLNNEGALAIQDSASNLNAASASATVAAAASVKVNASTGNDDVTNSTTAKVTLAVGALANLAATSSTTGVDVLHLKAGDVIDLSGIADFDTVASSNQGYLTSGDITGTTGALYSTSRGYYGADGSFTASTTGTDTLISLQTDHTAGADQVIVLVGTTTLTTITNGTAGQVVGFTAA